MRHTPQDLRLTPNTSIQKEAAMQMYKTLPHILTAVLLTPQHLENTALQQIEPFAPPTGDINFGIIAEVPFPGFRRPKF